MLHETIKSGDWKGEKHVPVILVESELKKGEAVKIKVDIGEEIPHPNTLEHHIAWIKVFYKADGAGAPVEVASAEFQAHGELGIFTEPVARLEFTPEESGVIYAMSYCNIHGLWENELKIELA